MARWPTPRIAASSREVRTRRRRSTGVGGGRGTFGWDDVRVPEVAKFLGWNADAVDVGGRWRFAYEEPLGASSSPHGPSRRWTTRIGANMTAPGDDRPRFRDQDKELRVPAVFRREFTLTEASVDELLRAGQGKCYLYVWTLARANRPIEAAINGMKVGHVHAAGQRPRWCVFEVGEKLRDGRESAGAAFALVGDFLPHLPLADGRRAAIPTWGPRGTRDGSISATSSSGRVPSRCARAWRLIRREDADKYIKLMSPNGMIDYDKALAEDYGGVFPRHGLHVGLVDRLPARADAQFRPALHHRAGGRARPARAETVHRPLDDRRRQAVDYFMNLGEILWDPAQKAWFETNLPLVRLVGKYHAPPAERGRDV